MSKKIIYIIIFVLFIAFLCFSFFYNKKIVHTPTLGDTSVTQSEQLDSQNNSQNYNVKQFKIGGKILKVEIASTSVQREKGLSGKTSLKEDEGMLFVFDNQGVYYFWMKDMFLPIDIIWFSPEWKIIYIQKNATPDSYPKVFGPSVNSKYVLETISGFAEKNNLKTGDTAELLK